MKLDERYFDTTLKAGLAGVPGILIYGPDNGKNGEFADKIIKRLEIEPDNLISTDGAGFKDNFDSIFSDACSAAMFGGNKLVLLRDPDGRDTALVQRLCASAMAPVVIVAGELESSSGLRKFFENDEKCAALPLYADKDESVAQLIRKTLADNGITRIDGDAMQYMTGHLGRDRSIARGFLEKLAIFVDDKKSVALDDAEKCLPDTGSASSMDEFKYNLIAGHLTAALRALDRLFAENAAPAQLVRALGSQFKDLLNCVVGGQMPRVFWKYEGLFNAARRFWTEAELTRAIVGINKLETDLHGGVAADAELLFRDFAMKLAARSYKLSITKK
ncbi:MAG: hypothetical protein LBL46_04730 [Rickettsiales bacterium]|jgi:DNA polymerase-3 subunit delta|nr:hypothetical protein [Rickettsiales bacterium]